mgnify:CR=1 FL=1
MTCDMPNCPAPVDYEGDYCTEHLLPDESEPTVVDRDVITVLTEMACASTEPRARAAFDRFYRRAVRLRLEIDRLRAELATAREKAVEDIIAALAAHPRDVWLVEDLVMWLRALATRGSTP